MRRVIGVFALVLYVSLVAGCGGSHQRGLATPDVGFVDPPPWLGKIVEREARLLGDAHPRTIEYHFGKQRDVAMMFGRFETPPPVACTTSYCPVPVRLRGWNLRLVVSTRTHRILSARIGQAIAHTQAPEIAWHASRLFRIFPQFPGTVSCKIPRGGLGAVRLRGRCMISYVSSPPYGQRAIRIRFGERWRDGGRVHRGGWIVTVLLKDGRVQSIRVIGQPPQLWE
jgi:hypothetical protein